MTAKKGMIQETARRVPTVLNHRNGRLQEASDVPTSIALVIRIQSQTKKNRCRMMPKWWPDIASGVSPISVALVLVLHCSYPCSDVVLTIPGSQIHETQDAWYWPETNGDFFGNLKRHPGRGWNLHFSHTFWTHRAGEMCWRKYLQSEDVWSKVWNLENDAILVLDRAYVPPSFKKLQYVWVYFCWTESWINKTHKKSFREKFANI